MPAATMKASEFKAKCLAVMDEVARTGKPVLVTKNGVPVAELHPVGGPRRKSLLGLHKGQIHALDDLIEPVAEDVMAQIDRAAAERGLARSTFVAEVLAKVARARTDVELSRRIEAVFADPAVRDEQRSSAADFTRAMNRTGTAW